LPRRGRGHQRNRCSAPGQEGAGAIRIRNEREALRLIAHFVGDIHQPLHVASVYLDADGRPVDPDHDGSDPDSKTRGGNDLRDGSHALHAEWDDVPTELKADTFARNAVAEAEQVPTTPGAPSGWSTTWATDTIVVGKIAFSDVAYSAEDTHRQWKVTLPPGYNEMKEKLQREQLIKAGARLAQLLTALFPQ